MSADYSRWPRRRRDYTAVRLQQGRVLTDADWNEQSLMPERRERLETIDGLGRAVVPTATSDAFKVATVAGPDLTIGVGRAYLDGILVENIGTQGPFNPVTAEFDGVGPVRYTSQPWFPGPPALPPPPYAAYLKAWQRERTAVEDPSLVEPALGVDTSARTQTVWQVKAIAVPPGTACAGVDALIAAAETAAAGRLTTATAVVPGQPDPCRVVPGGGYTGLENQLYRVEVHRGGVVGGAGGATFKWSRDGGSVASRVLSINAARDRIVVDTLGRDSVLGIKDGDWIEIVDDEHELLGIPGELRRVATGGGVEESTNTILLESALPAAGTAFPVDAQGRTLPERATRVRRWDQSGQILSSGGANLTNLNSAGSTGAITIPGANVGVLLEHSVVVRFSLPASGRFRTGDYWLFAARTADASVELLDQAPPLGVHAHYAPLAIVTGQVSDCRTVVPPLGEMESLHYLAGDGQEATPSYLNPGPILLPVRATVGVQRGSLPIEGRTVRFNLLDGVDAGTIEGVGPIRDVVTGSDGQASVAWALGWAGRDSQKLQRLSATLLDDLGVAVGLPIVFSARLRTADEVAYDPTNCGGPNGPATVQEALDQLCNRPDEGGCCSTVRPGDRLADAIAASGQAREGHACVCLQPGIYQLRADDVSELNSRIRELVSLTMSGRGARIELETPLSIEGLSALDISEIELTNLTEKVDVLVEVIGCANVTIDGITAVLVDGTDSRAVLRFGSGEAEDSRPAIRIRNCSIANGQRRERRPLFVMEDFPAIAGRVFAMANSGMPVEEASAELRGLLDQPEELLRAEAIGTDDLLAANRESLDARGRRTLERLSEVIRVGEPLSPSRFRPLLERVRGLADFGSRAVLPPAGIEVLDGRGDVWIEDNLVRGTLTLYGSLSVPDREEQLRRGLVKLYTNPDAIEVPTLPAGVGHLRVAHNTIDRIGLAGAANERLVRFLESRELREVELFDSAHFDGNTLVEPFQAIVAESVTFASNTVGGQFEPQMGFVYGNAGTVIGNVGRDFGQLLLAAAQAAEVGNRRIIVNPSGIHP